MTDNTSDTDEIPVPRRTEVERKPRIARGIRVLALPIVVIWLLVAVGVNIFVPQLEAVAEDVSVPLSPSDAPSVTGMKHIGEKFKEYDSDNLVLVTLVGDKPLGPDAHRYYDELVKKLKQDTKHVEHALDFWGQRFTASGVESYDHKSAYVQVNLRGDQGGAVGDKSVDSVRQIVADSQPPPGVKAYVAGQGALTDDTIVVGNESLFKMTIITIIIIAIMLAFVYRSVGTVLLTMVILFVGLATGRGVVALLGSTGIMGLSTFAVNLLTALAIAAGTDYAIFMVGRYQEGRERGLDREAAYYDTFAGVSKVVLGSGLTIVGALACLHFTRLPYFSSLAFPCAIGLLVVVAAGVTLTPALIAFASGFGLFDPKRKFNYTRWRRLATAIVRWPAPILATSVILAIVGALGLSGFNPRYNDLYYLPKSAASVQAYDAADKHFTQARLNPDLLMIESDHDLRNPTDMLVLDKIAGAIFRVPGIERVQSITRPLGPPIQDGSVPFQLSVQTAPIRSNLNYLKDRVADIKKITGFLDTQITLLERQYAITQKLADAADDSSKTTGETAAITDEIRDHIADFDDFWRPIRSYFYWEKHCYDIPICWSLRSLFDALDGFDQLAEKFHALTSDLNNTATATRELLAIIPENIAVTKAIRDTTLNIYSTFDNLVDQFDRLTDTNAVMGKSFNDSQIESVFYLPPEIFQNPDFQLGLSLMVSPDGKAARFIITHSVDPATTEGIASVDKERNAAKEALKLTSLQNADIYLGGTAATFYDIANGAKYDLLIAAVASIVLIFIIMVIVTRALVAAGVIVGTIVMSLGAAFGFSTLIWQHLLNFQLHWVATEFALIVLLAVGSDYNLMLVSRIEEELGAGLKTGLIRGMGLTGPVVTAAGLVFAVTMATMITSDLRAIGQFGTTIGLGLMFDTFVVRSLITPSIMTVMGRWFWWPKRVRVRPASQMLRSVGPRPLVRALLYQPRHPAPLDQQT
ncbi:RND family transporter [Mycobacterium simiae]|uniref:MMPL/RND family transporter n=1 Tax=Mycobacterium simiae TaxID=1784 RepID=UPI00040635F0|nr:RND family transporter [Mycobacterium simiae]PLV54829.1 membrane protein [Mycobacterium tuberculosis variant microti OV254]BBX41919.1 membrane protein [Mycobacterium simiae]